MRPTLILVRSLLEQLKLSSAPLLIMFTETVVIRLASGTCLSPFVLIYTVRVLRNVI